MSYCFHSCPKSSCIPVGAVPIDSVASSKFQSSACLTTWHSLSTIQNSLIHFLCSLRPWTEESALSTNDNLQHDNEWEASDWWRLLEDGIWLVEASPRRPAVLRPCPGHRSPATLPRAVAGLMLLPSEFQMEGRYKQPSFICFIQLYKFWNK